MKYRSGFRKLLFYLSSPSCVCCHEGLSVDDIAFCSKCSIIFKEKLTRNCSICAKVLSECECSTSYLRDCGVNSLCKTFRYLNNRDDSVEASLIYALKRRPRWDTAELATDLLYNAVKNRLGELKERSSIVITNVPRRRESVIKYGVDHSALMAKELAKRLGIRFIPLLSSNAKREQKQLTREERIRNASFKIKSKRNLKDKRVIIVDDVVTSGASMGAASRLIRSLGAKEVSGLTLAIAYPDEQ